MAVIQSQRQEAGLVSCSAVEFCHSLCSCRNSVSKLGCRTHQLLLATVCFKKKEGDEAPIEALQVFWMRLR